MAMDRGGKGNKPRTGGQSPPKDTWAPEVTFGSPEAKIPVNIRLDADIVRYFRVGGPGYQTRINGVLKAYMLAAHAPAGDIQPKARVNGRKRM